jgi:hypothetical protein
VIPLGPLRLNDILNGAFATIGGYWKQLFALAAIVYGAAVLAVAVAAVVAYAAVGGHLFTLIDLPSGVDPSWDDIRPLLIGFGCLWIFGFLVLLVTTATVQAICPVVVQDAVLGRPATVIGVWRRASPRVPAVLGTVLLSGLIYFVPALLVMVIFAGGIAVAGAEGSDQAFWLLPLGLLCVLALVPLAIWLSVRFSLAPTVAAVEPQGPVMALRRSVRLVRGNWWRIFGISMLGYLTAGFVSGFLEQLITLVALFPGVIDTNALTDLNSEPTAQQIFSAVGGFVVVALVVSLIGQIISATFPQIVLNLLYVDQRIRRENLAAALIAAAGPVGNPAGVLPPTPTGPPAD